MTNEEAIERIDYKEYHCNDDMNCDWECEKCNEAKIMAIEALEIAKTLKEIEND